MKRRKIKIALKPLAYAWGYADAQARVIELDHRMDDRTMLGIAAHEVIHIECPFLTEEWVNQLGEQIGDVLYRLGFRRADHIED